MNDEQSWCRDSVFGQSFIQTLDNFVKKDELTDNEARKLLKKFNDSFSDVMRRPPADGIPLKDRRQSIDATIESRNRCNDFLMFELEDFVLKQGDNNIKCDKVSVYLTGADTTRRYKNEHSISAKKKSPESHQRAKVVNKKCSKRPSLVAASSISKMKASKKPRKAPSCREGIHDK